jgi:hypothetical protein
MAICKPAVAKVVVHMDTDIQGNTEQVTSTASELVGCIAGAGWGAIAVRIYDTANGVQDPLARKIFIAANAGEGMAFTPCQPMPFEHGIFVVFEQGGVPPGGGLGGGEISLVINR